MLEVLIGFSIVGVLFVALYLGFSSGFAIVQLSRENLRGTQILQEKMETIRLYTWDQINTPGFIPNKFIEPFYAAGTNLTGLLYTGKVSVADAPIGETYSNDLKMVTMEVKWLSGGVERKRDMITFVSRYGLQHYIY